MEDKSKEKVHYYLITGEIIFSDEENNISGIRVNGVIALPEQKLAARYLGKAQQILQVNFMQKMGEIKITIADVILMNFTYLGHMSQEEFHQPPEGTKLAPKLTPVDLDKAVAQAEASNAPTTAADEVDGQPVQE